MLPQQSCGGSGWVRAGGGGNQCLKVIEISAPPHPQLGRLWCKSGSFSIKWDFSRQINKAWGPAPNKNLTKSNALNVNLNGRGLPVHFFVPTQGIGEIPWPWTDTLRFTFMNVLSALYKEWTDVFSAGSSVGELICIFLISNCICPNFKIYLSKFRNVLSKLHYMKAQDFFVNAAAPVN